MFNLANCYFYQNHFKKSKRELHTLLKVFPKNIVGHILLAILYSKEGDVRESDAVLNNALSIDPSNSIVRLYLAKSYIRSGQKLAKAKMYLEQILHYENKKNYEAQLQ